MISLRIDKPLQELTSYDLLRVYARCGTFQDSAKFLDISRETFSKTWYELGLPSPKATRIQLAENPDLPYHEVALVSDTHWGSIYQQKTFFEAFIQDCKDRGIQMLLHCGDIIDGVMPRNEDTRFLQTPEEFEEYVIQNYPTGFEKNYIISGNHEASLKGINGTEYDFCKEVTKRLPGVTYVENQTPIVGPGNILFHSNHGTRSCSTINSPRTKQLKKKTIQLMSSGCFGHIFVYGHCHNFSYIPSYMNATVVGLGCFQNITTYIRKRFTSVDLCGTILSYQVENNKPINIKVTPKYITDYMEIQCHDY